MKELRRLVWRYYAGRCLREKLRDCFAEEVASMNQRMRGLCNPLQDITSRPTPEGRIAREFEEYIHETIRQAEAAHFDNALRSITIAALRLQIMEEIATAWSAINRVEDQLKELQKGLKGTLGLALGDFHILSARARTFYEQEKYPTTRLIACETLEALTKLTTTAEAKDPPANLTRRMERLEHMANILQDWDVAAEDSAQVRMSLETIHHTMSNRQYELSQLLISHLEADKASMNTFIDLLHLLRKNSSPAMARQILAPWQNGAKLDWTGASEFLLADSFAQISGWMEQHISTFDQRVLSAGENA